MVSKAGTVDSREAMEEANIEVKDVARDDITAVKRKEVMAEATKVVSMEVKDVARADTTDVRRKEVTEEAIKVEDMEVAKMIMALADSREVATAVNNRMITALVDSNRAMEVQEITTTEAVEDMVGMTI